MKNFKTTPKLIALKALALLVTVAFFTACQDDGFSKGTEQIISYDYLQVATGQTTLFDADGEEIYSLNEGDAFYGQDANYLKGVNMSYVDNGDGTTSDLNTGLMWQTIPIPDGRTYDAAIEYVENLELAGYDDWRAPSLKELFSISDFGKGWPYLDTTYFKLASGVVDKSEQFWSSNRYVGTTVEG